MPIKYFAAVALAGAISLGGAGCASGPANAPATNARTLGERLVGGLTSAYVEFRRESFEQLLSADFRPSKTEFAHSTEARARAETVQELTPIVHLELPSGDQLMVRFTWRKSAIPSGGGTSIKTRGSAEFIFRQESGGWRLLERRGDNPF